VSEELRALAEQVRLEAAHRLEDKRAKCAQLLRAAGGLELLRQKLGGSHVR